MITLKNVTLRRSAKVLLDGVTATINPGEKVGLVGRNGAGKSTLFALLNGSLHEDGGDFFMPPQWRMAQVAQHMPETEDSATQFVLDGDTRASVSASYKIGGRDVSTTLRLVGDGRTSWLLVDGTADLTLSAPTGLTVNGVPVTESTNPAFPGSYVVATNSAPTVIAQGDTTALLATPDSEPASLTVAAALSDEGRQTVLNTVKGRLDECLTATESRPANCPFGVRTDNVEVAPGSVRFALANDPWADFHPALDPATMRVTGRLHLSVDATATITQNGLSTDATQRLEADRTYTVALTQQPLAVVWS